jgi:murein DD-endopeptidase MepM/ murein hydrolase activator NlpD
MFSPSSRARTAPAARSANSAPPRDYGRTHEGFDIVAACGTPLFAVRNGKVLRTG